jgi:hypothetical protein
MHKPFLSLLGLFGLLATTSLQAANAPTSIAGKKFISVSNPIEDETINATQFFVGDWFYRFNTENTNWTQANYSWSTSGAIGTLQFGSKTAEYGFYEAALNFSDNTFEVYFEDSNTSRIYGGYGSFELSDFSAAELPFNQFFSGSLQNSIDEGYLSFVKDYGMTASLYQGAYTISGTSPSKDERWPETGANSLLSLDLDWVVKGSAFSNSPKAVKISLEADVEAQFQLEVHVGHNGSSIHYSIQYERYETPNYQEQYFSSSEYNSELSSSKKGTFRIRNSASEKTFHLEWLNGTEWKNINSLNWETGTLSKPASSSNMNSLTKLNDWESMEKYYFNPQMEFEVPDSLTVNLGDYGFTSFSVTEGAPTTAPSSLAGKLYQTQGGDQIQFLTDTTGTFHHAESNFQQSEVSGITYTWATTGGNAGTLATDLDETITLTFTSETGGSYDWRELSGDMETGQGTFTLTDASTGYAPADLAGDSLISGTTTYVFKDNGKVVVRSPNGSSESAYAYLKTGENAGVLAVPAQVDGVTSTFYKLSYSSMGQGSFSEGSSASFDYFADRTNMPAAKGWLWFDQYPWVYSNREGGWLYFLPSNGKINVYSVQDKAWREMSKTE